MPSFLHANDIPSVYSTSKYSVFLICSFSKCGTGVSISKDTMITANHVVPLDLTYDIYSQVTQDHLGTAKVSNRDPKNDIAYLSFKNPYGVYMSFLGEDKTLRMGTRVYAVGYPLKSTLRVTTGHYFGNVFPNDTRVGITAPTIFGNSGGPVLVKTDEGYRIIGIVSAIMGAKNSVVPHMGIVIPYKTILRGMR